MTESPGDKALRLISELTRVRNRLQLEVSVGFATDGADRLRTQERQLTRELEDAMHECEDAVVQMTSSNLRTPGVEFSESDKAKLRAAARELAQIRDRWQRADQASKPKTGGLSEAGLAVFRQLGVDPNSEISQQVLGEIGRR